MTAIRNIAVLRLGAMGDILFTTPVLRGLRHKYPDCRITYILLRKWRFLLARNPHVDRIVGLPYREPEALGALRRERFDLIVNLHELEDGARLCEALQASERRGHRWIGDALTPDDASRLLIKDKDTLMRLYREGVNYPQLFCRIAGVEYDGLPYDFDPGAFARFRAALFMRRRGLVAPVAIHCDSRGMPSKRWSNESVRRVVRALPSVRFVLLGYRPDRDRLRDLESEPDIVASYHPVPVQAEIIRRAALFVGIDSGPRQIASAMGTPVLGLYGPRPPELLPVFPGERALSIHVNCAPCFDEECPRGKQCMDLLEPERIAESIRAMLTAPLRQP